MRRFLFGLLIMMSVLLPAQAQDGLNLPTELYILLNEGVIERYGLGTAGVDMVTPDDEFVLDFDVSPDGNWLAYRTESGLYLRHMYDDMAEVRELEGAAASIPPMRGSGDTMAWSPNSDVLAYTTETGVRLHFFETGAFAAVPAADDPIEDIRWSPDGSHLAAKAGTNWLLFQRNGTSMVVVSALLDVTGASWFDGSQLIFTPAAGGVRVINLSNQNEQVTLADASAQYFLPFVTDDNRVKMFRGERLSAELVAMELDGFTVEPLGTGQLDLTGLRWAPRGDLAIAFQGGALALVDPVSANGFTLPVTQASAYNWGPAYPPRVGSVSLSSAATFLALDSNAIQQVWQLPPGGDSAAPLTAAQNDITAYALSVDGNQIAYVSNGGLWVADLTGETEPRELVMLGINANVVPAWSPDGQLYYRDVQDDAAGIWRVMPDAGNAEPSLFLEDTADSAYQQPRLAPGLNAMLVNRGDALVLVDTTNSSESYVGQYSQARWLNGSQILAAGNPMLPELNTRGLYTLDVNNRETTTTLLLPTAGDFRVQDFRLVDDDTVRLLLQRGNFAQTRVFEVPLTGGAVTVIGNAGYMTTPKLAPDGTTAVGYTHPGGALLVYDVASGEQRLLSSFSQVQQFAWTR